MKVGNHYENTNDAHEGNVVTRYTKFPFATKPGDYSDLEYHQFHFSLRASLIVKLVIHSFFFMTIEERNHEEWAQSET